MLKLIRLIEHVEEIYLHRGVSIRLGGRGIDFLNNSLRLIGHVVDLYKIYNTQRRVCSSRGEGEDLLKITRIRGGGYGPETIHYTLSSFIRACKCLCLVMAFP